ncbi:reverse transcriptase-like protein [Bacillus sp. FJAT-47783]|uniref:reverse transcriptase-like protein n=1 Tax=Bacillus sp. FJAT-47783 TaxID=2922712 RepID=UPI001FACB7E6|nr:reverse transcriptase-like protein [Bacillus sp. FJAT-47783]
MIEVYIDGASAGDPGLSGAGIYIKGNGVNYKERIPLGMMNNHEAEFYALIHALTLCANEKFSILSIRTDSQAIEQAIEKRFAKKEPYQSLLENALTLMEQFEFCFVKWIPAKENAVADKLAREAIHLNDVGGEKSEKSKNS